MTADENKPIPDLAGLLDDIDRMVSKYVAFPHRHHAVVVVLWIVHTWTVISFYVTPRLILDSAEPGSGKTRVLELLALLCRSAKLTLSTTTAALYRRIAAAEDAGDAPPTVLQDEADAVFGKNANPQSEDLRALFNAGYKRGATVDRCEGDAKNMKVREFPVWSPLALAGLAGRMPDTITSRGITLHMRRRRPDQTLADFRERDAQFEAAPIRDQLDAWAAANHDTLADARPTMPAGVTDRSAEIWEPLLAIADMAGGDWSLRAHAACTYFVVGVAAEDEKLSLGQRLLRDIKKLMEAENATAMWSADIIRGLTADLESEWRDLWGKTLDQRRLAKELARYDIKSKNVRAGVAVSKGYEIDGPTGLRQAWDTWLAPPPSATSATTVTEQLRGLSAVAEGQPAATSATAPLHQKSASELEGPENVAAVAAVAEAGQTAASAALAQASLCPECSRAPARTDTGLCDFCTAKRRRQQTSGPKPACKRWFKQYIAQLRAAGHTTAESRAVYDAGLAEGYTIHALRTAASGHPDIAVISRAAKGATWRIDGSQQEPYQPAAEWVTAYLGGLPAGTTTVDKAAFKEAAEAAGHSWTSARHAATESGRVESVQGGPVSDRETTWVISPPTEGEAS